MLPFAFNHSILGVPGGTLLDREFRGLLHKGNVGKRVFRLRCKSINIFGAARVVPVAGSTDPRYVGAVFLRM